MSLYGNSIIDYRNTQVVNEAYVGKTPTLEEIEKKIGELRENIKFSDNLLENYKIKIKQALVMIYYFYNCNLFYHNNILQLM